MTRETDNSKTGGDWPTLLKDNARTGGQGLRPAHPPERAVWQFRAGSSVRSAPVLGDGILYVASVSGTLHAIRADTGTASWKFQAAGQIHSTPSLSAGQVLFGSDDGKVYHSTGGRNEAVGGCHWSRSLVIACDSEWSCVFWKRGRTGLCGRRCDRPEIGHRARGKIYSTIYAAEHQLYLGCGDGKVYCLDASSGKILWSSPTGNGIDSSPSLADDLVLIGSEDFFVYAMKATQESALEIRNEDGRRFFTRRFRATWLFSVARMDFSTRLKLKPGAAVENNGRRSGDRTASNWRWCCLHSGRGYVCAGYGTGKSYGELALAGAMQSVPVLAGTQFIWRA